MRGPTLTALMKNRNRFVPLFFLCTCLCFMVSFLHADATAQDAKQLLQASHEVSDPGQLLPYELHGTVLINPGTPNEKKGHVLIYRDKDRSRTEFQVEGITEVKLTVGNKLYVWRSTPMPVPNLGRLAETDHTWDKLAEVSDARLSDVSKKKLHDQQVNCFEVKREQRLRLCFDPARKVLLESLSQQLRSEFRDS